MFGELEVSQEPLERKQLFQQVLRAKHLLTMRVFGCNPSGRACQQALRAKHLLTMRCFRQRKGNSIRRQVRTHPQLRDVWGTIQSLSLIHI